MHVHVVFHMKGTGIDTDTDVCTTASVLKIDAIS